MTIDHAWGWEPCTIADIKAYKPSTKSIGSGQVLQCPYDINKAKIVVKEMADQLVLDLVDKKLMTNQITLKEYTSSSRYIMQSVIELYDRIIDKNLLIRRINITANRVLDEETVAKEESYEQLSLFADYQDLQEEEQDKAELDREKRIQEAMLEIKHKYGKNAILKGVNLMDGATTIDRNKQIGGHKA